MQRLLYSEKREILINWTFVKKIKIFFLVVAQIKKETNKNGNVFEYLYM